MSDEEDDYMSDNFLAKCCDIKNDVRPGLIRSHAEERTFRTLKRKKEHDEINRSRNPSVKVLESEKRKEGLERPIEGNNKGYVMLQKMGYNPGNGIGRRDIGRTEPIPIELKTDREGLGRARMKQEMYEKQIAEIQKSTISTSEYRLRLTEKAVKRQIEIDLRKSQRMCERFDAENNIFEPVEKWYWFSTDPENFEVEKETQELNMKRRKRYSDSDNNEITDIASDEDTHTSVFVSEDEDDADELPLMKIGVSEKLWDITTYLRNKYHYCIWCSVKYNDEDDLREECPGRTRDDH